MTRVARALHILIYVHTQTFETTNYKAIHLDKSKILCAKVSRYNILQWHRARWCCFTQSETNAFLPENALKRKKKKKHTVDLKNQPDNLFAVINIWYIVKGTFGLVTSCYNTEEFDIEKLLIFFNLAPSLKYILKYILIPVSNCHKRYTTLNNCCANDECVTDFLFFNT